MGSQARSPAVRTLTSSRCSILVRRGLSSTTTGNHLHRGSSSFLLQDEEGCYHPEPLPLPARIFDYEAEEASETVASSGKGSGSNKSNNTSSFAGQQPYPLPGTKGNQGGGGGTGGGGRHRCPQCKTYVTFRHGK